MIRWIILLLGVSGLLVPVFLIILLIQGIFGVNLMEQNYHNNHKEKRYLFNNVSAVFSVVSAIATVITACFIYNQAQIAKEATIPNLVVSIFNDEERKGLYVTNFGKGHAIIDSIQIGTKKDEVITEKIWNSALTSVGINGDTDCFAWSPIQKNIVLRAGETNILLGKRQGIWTELENNKKIAQKLAQDKKLFNLMS